MTRETTTAPRKVWISTCGTIHAATKSAAAATSQDTRSLNGLIFGRTIRCSGVVSSRVQEAPLRSVAWLARSNTDACHGSRVRLPVFHAGGSSPRVRGSASRLDGLPYADAPERRSPRRRPTSRRRSSGRTSTRAPRAHASRSRYSSRSSSCVRSQSRNATMRSTSSHPAENTCTFTFVSGPLNSRCSYQSGSRMRRT